MKNTPEGIDPNFSSFGKKESYKPPNIFSVPKKDKGPTRRGPRGEWAEEDFPTVLKTTIPDNKNDKDISILSNKSEKESGFSFISKSKDNIALMENLNINKANCLLSMTQLSDQK